MLRNWWQSLAPGKRQAFARLIVLAVVVFLLSWIYRAATDPFYFHYGRYSRILQAHSETPYIRGKVVALDTGGWSVTLDEVVQNELPDDLQAHRSNDVGTAVLSERSDKIVPNTLSRRVQTSTGRPAGEALYVTTSRLLIS